MHRWSIGLVVNGRGTTKLMIMIDYDYEHVVCGTGNTTHNIDGC